MSRLSDDRAARLPEVSRLTARGLSQRAIAARLQVSQATIRRDLQHLKKEGQRAMAHRTPEPADAPPGESPPAPGESPGDSPERARVTKALLTDTGQRRLTIDADGPLINDLITLMDGTGGADPQEIINACVHVVAGAYRWLVEHQVLNGGRPISVRDVTIREPGTKDLEHLRRTGARRTFPLHDPPAEPTDREE